MDRRIGVTGAIVIGLLIHSQTLFAGEETASSPDLAGSAKSGNLMKLWYNKPAGNWARYALPIGNGRLGGMVFGKTEVETIQLNEITLWSGGPNCSPGFTGGNKKGAWRYLKGIQENMLAGKPANCGLLCGNGIGWNGYQNLGKMTLDFRGKARTRKPKNYRRELDLNDGLVRVSYENGGVSFTREHFASFPGKVMVTRLAASENGALDFVLGLSPDVSPDGYRRPGREGNASKRFTTRVQDHVITCLGEQVTSRMKFAVQIKLLAPGAEIKDQGDGTISVSKAREAFVILSAETNYDIGEMANIREIADYHTPDGDFLDNGDPDGRGALGRVAERVQKASAKSYAELLGCHLGDYRELFRKAELDLGGAEYADQPTDQLLYGYNHGKKNAYLENLLFQMGRYMLIASSRDSVLPANLQGLWNNSNKPAWAGDYHFNVNLQMNYWPAFVCNIASTADPLVSFLDALRPLGNLTAREHFGIKNPEAWVCTTSATPLGFLGVGWQFVWGWTPGSAAWICNNIWDYYRFTQSREVLERIYPILKGASLFWTEFLVENPEKPAELISVPSTSSEHGRPGIAATYDLSLAKMLLLDTIEASRILDRDPELRKEFVRVVSRIHPYQVGADGQLKEWREEHHYNRDVKGRPLGEFGHRHMSHLLGLHPGTLITRGQPDLMRAAIRALELRGDGSGNGTGGWSMAQKINLWARTGNGNKAHYYLGLLLNGGINPNLFDTIGPFQIDGNFGATAGMAEMLIQSQNGVVEPLPALPECWPEGSYRGLVARGNFETDATWKEGRMTRFALRSGSGRSCRVSYPGLASFTVTCGGKPVKVRVENRNTLSFETLKGREYLFERSAASR